MRAALNLRQFASRWVTTAAKNTVSKTGIGLGSLVYLLLGTAIGSCAYCGMQGGDKLLDQWYQIFAYVIVGTAGTWAVAMFLSMIAAPFQIHREDHVAFALALSARESETAAQFTLLREELHHINDERNGLKDQIAERDAVPKTRRGDRNEAIRKLRSLGKEGGEIMMPTLNMAQEYCGRSMSCAEECLDPAWSKDLRDDIQAAHNGNYSREIEKAQALIAACSRWLNSWETAMKDHHVNQNFRVPA